MISFIPVKLLEQATHVEMLESYENSGITEGRIYEVRFNDDTEEYYVIDDNENRNYAALIVVKNNRYKLNEN